MTVSASPPASWWSYFAFSRTSRSIPELDGWRAIAVMLVLGRHAVHPLYKDNGGFVPLGSWDLAFPFINGWIGVDLFFVLSGFLITRHLLRLKEGVRASGVGRYMGARALRIIPTYFTVLFIIAAGLIPLFEISQHLLWVRVIYHMLFLQDYLPNNIVGAFWTLGVEEKFYILAPLLVYGAVRAGTRARQYGFLICLIGLPVVFRAITAYRNPEINGYYDYFFAFRTPFHLSFDGLATGVFIAFLNRDRDSLFSSDRSRLRWTTAIFWLSLASFLVHLFAVELWGEINVFVKVLLPLTLSLTFGGLVMASVFGGGVRRPLRSGLLLVIARISYPLYLIHHPLVPMALLLSAYRVGDGIVAFMGYLAVFVAISFLCAFALHYLVEKPFLLLKDRISY